MKWLWKRMQEPTSKGLIVAAATAGAGMASGVVDQQTAIGAIIAALIGVLIPERKPA